MKNKNWLKDLVDEFSYTYYLENYPTMVEGIRQLLARGEKPASIKMFCDRIAGKSLTANTIACMIDYVNKQVKN